MSTTSLTAFRPARFVAAVAMAVLLATAWAETLVGEVVSVADGDTVTVLDATKVQHRVRLAAIDAPERRQAFGDRSRQHLASLVFRKQVSVEWQKLDRYGRILGKVLVGQDDAGLYQIRAGMAWHYKEFAHEQAPDDRDAYTPESAEKMLQSGLADLVAFGQPFITNPDFVNRVRKGLPLTPVNYEAHSTFYGGDHRGYTDYPNAEHGEAVLA